MKAGRGMAEKPKNKVTVNIMGDDYILRGSSTTDQIYRVGRYVDKLMKSLAEKNTQVSKHKIAVLAAINLADELMKTREGREAMNADQARKSSDNDELA